MLQNIIPAARGFDGILHFNRNGKKIYQHPVCMCRVILNTVMMIIEIYDDIGEIYGLSPSGIISI